MDPAPLALELDAGALATNLARVRALAGQRRIIASLKANAYGHGTVPIARALAALGVDELATGSLDEVRALRAAGVTSPVMLLATSLPDDVGELEALGAVPTVTSVDAARRLASSGPAATVYVKVDVGLGRLGIPVAEAADALEAIDAIDGLTVKGVYTHAPFRSPAPEHREWAAGCLAAFDRLLEQARRRGRVYPVTQASASCALLAGLADGCNAVCVGHLLYGVSPFGAERDPPAGFRPVLAGLATTLVHVGEHGQGSDVAVANEYRIERRRRLGVVPVGLAHGVGRPVAGHDAWCTVAGVRARIVSVSLEHAVVEVDHLPDARPGDRVDLVGGDGERPVTIGEMARWLGASPLETLTRLSGRARVRLRDESADPGT